MGMCMSKQQADKFKGKQAELTPELVNAIAAIVNEDNFQSLRKKETYQRVYRVILKLDICPTAIKKNKEMSDVMHKLDKNENFKSSLEIFQLGKWSSIMKEIQMHECKVIPSNINDNNMESIDLVLHNWFKIQCKFDADECLHYVDVFKSNGLITVDRVQEITDSDFDATGIQTRKRKIILSNITHLIFALIKHSKQ
eukprot:59647_1